MKHLLILAGPTCVGKTETGIVLAKHFGTEILSADSRQIYAEMNVGTAVPSEEQLKIIKHHFIRNVRIHQYYNVAKYEAEALRLMEQLFIKSDLVVMVGGSGMYIDVVCNGIDDLPDPDPELRNQLLQRLESEGLESLRFELKRRDPDFYASVDLKNKNRILRGLEVSILTGKPFSSLRKNKAKIRDFNIIKIALYLDRDVLYKRIDSRTDQMILNGLPEEAARLYEFRHLNALNTVGYKEYFDQMDGKITLPEAAALIKRNTRRYAKKQLSWLRRDNEYEWFLPQDTDRIIEFVNRKMIVPDSDH